jgi:hypothetical protein
MLLFVNFSTYSEDVRSGPIDLYLLIDTSSSLSSHYSEALSWIRSAVFEEILQKGDSVTVIGAGESVQILSESAYIGPESSQGLEKLLQSIRLQGTHADLAGAIRVSKRKDAAKSNPRALAVALMITGTDNRETVSNGEQTKDLETLLKYSKVEDFPGWKLIIIGLNVDGKIKAAAAEYQAFLNTLEQKAP